MRQISSGCGDYNCTYKIMYGLLDFPCHTVFAAITRSKCQRVCMPGLGSRYVHLLPYKKVQMAV